MRVETVLKTKVKNNHKINKLSHDSRLVEAGDIFFAINGSKVNGEDFIEDAIRKGAKTIITEHLGDIKTDVNIVIVNNVRKTLALAYKRLYQKYVKKITFIGVTGTNGKTTTTTLVYKYMQFCHIKACLIGSNGIYLDNEHYDSVNTTPDISIIYEYIKKACDINCKYMIMEVSSHAIKQLRVYGLDFKVLLFTNLTLDHLDFHPDFTDYKYTKGLLLHDVSNSTYVLLNTDCDHYEFYNYISQGIIKTYGTNESDYWIHSIELVADKSKFALVYKNKTKIVETNLIGLFNVYNITAFMAIIDVLKINNKLIDHFLTTKIIIPGRMEEVSYDNRRIIIDFAHTPDGVFNVLNFLKELHKRIILVIGCGGSRDKTKRTVIGQISVENSHYVIFTSDNPRDEDEMAIIKDIIVDIEKENYEIIVDRKDAIKKAIVISQENDIIAILGRGNEMFQKVKGKLIPLNDMEIVQEIIKGE